MTMDVGMIEEVASLLEAEEDARAVAIGKQGGVEIHPLTQEEVAAIVASEIQSSSGQLGSQISQERMESLEYYRGELFGNEVEGRSKVVLSDVQDTVEWAMPGLMRMFLGGNVVVRYGAKSGDPKAIATAEQATGYVDHCFMKKNRGFRLLYDAFKSSLISKNVVLKAWVEEYTEPRYESYVGVTDMELVALSQNPDVEITAAETRMAPALDADAGGAPTMVQVHDLEVKILERGKRLRAAVIPPEEFRIARRATCLDNETPFADHCRKVTISDLLSWGYDRDVVMGLPTGDSIEWDEERVTRLEDEDVWPTDGERADPASREVWIHDLFIRIDEDGDGYSELRHIVCAGESNVTILEDRPVSMITMVDLVPLPMPHQFFGNSLADLVKDLQKIRSTIVRQMLDNLYQVNNTQKEVVENMVQIDDLLTTHPGGIIRVKAPGMIKPLEQQPFPAMVLDFLGFFETQRENRTGITKASQGLDASTLQNTTATAAAQSLALAAAKIELIARVFKDSLERFFSMFLKLAVDSGLAPEPVKVRGQYETVNPATLDIDMDVEVEVGLGVGREQERLMMLQLMLQIQQQLTTMGFGGYLVTPEKFYNVAREISRVAGYPQPDFFVNDPARTQPPPPPGPTEEEKLEAAKLQVDAEKNRITQHKNDVDALREQALAEYRLVEIREKMAFEREKLDRELQVERERIAIEARTRIEVAKIAASAKTEAAEEREEESSGTEESDG